MSRKTIEVSAAKYQDCDDCLEAAAADYVRLHPEAAGWDLSARWADSERDVILLDVPVDVEIITWSAGEHQIDISTEAEEILTAAGVWPKTRGGQEYCQVYRGRHMGIPDIDAAKARAMVEAAKR